MKLRVRVRRTKFILCIGERNGRETGVILKPELQKGNPGSPRLKTPGKEKYVRYFLAHTNLMQAKAKQRVKVRKRSLQS